MKLPPIRFPIVPTARAAWAIALAAPIALVVAAAAPQAWIVAPALGVALIVLVVLDALVAGRLARWDIHAPQAAEVGEPFEVGFEAEIAGRSAGAPPRVALEFDPRLGNDGRAVVPLLRDESGAVWRGAASLVPNRRGPARLTEMWLRWSGPLGLGARQSREALDHEVRAWPSLAPVRSPELQTLIRNAQLGILARRIRGEGTQFEALAEYQPGMDRRRIDWKASARHTALYARENEAERNNQIVFAFDCGQSMSEPVDGLPRIDRAVTAALTAAYVALKGGDKVALFGFAQRPELATPFLSGTRAFHRLQNAAAGLDYHTREPNFTLALASLSARLKRRSLVVLFTDFTDPTGAELMIESIGRLLDKHLVIFVTMQDEELEAIVAQEPGDLAQLARAVIADTLHTQRALVLERLRRLGANVIEAPHDAIGYRLIDRYLEIKRSEAIG